MGKIGTQPPYTTAADIASFFERIGNKPPPSNLNKDWVENFKIAANQPVAIVALVKWLGIVDENGAAKPDVWNKIRQPGSRAEALAPLVREAYSAVFDQISAAEIATASREDLEGAFINAYEGIGDAEKKIKCFLTLCEYAGLKAAETKPSKASSNGKTIATSKTPKPKAPQQQQPPADTSRNGKKDTGAGTTPSVMIALNVEVPAAWTEDEVRERIAIVARAVREAKLDQA